MCTGRDQMSGQVHSTGWQCNNNNNNNKYHLYKGRDHRSGVDRRIAQQWTAILAHCATLDGNAIIGR